MADLKHVEVPKKPWPIHPFLFAIYPVVFAIATNSDKFKLYQSVLPSLFILSFCAIVLGLAMVVFRNFYKAALYVSILVVLFFVYNAVYKLAVKFDLKIFYYHLVYWYALFYAVTIFFVYKLRSNLFKVTKLLNIIALVLIVYNLSLLVFQSFYHQRWDPPQNEISNLKKPQQAPDIYYFMLDGYARADILWKLHDYDNTSFVSALRSRGFFVADSSHSNYHHTVASLAAALNFEFISQKITKNNTWSSLRDMLRHNRAFDILHKLGYDIYTFPNGLEWLTISTANHYQSKFHLDELSMVLFRMSPLPHVPGTKYLIQPLRQRVVLDPYSFIQNEKPERDPKLVYVHSICPHPPFLFAPDGTTTTKYDNNWWNSGWVPGPGYRDQVAFINNVMLKTIDTILKRAVVPPIIVIHGDHGSMTSLHGKTLKDLNYHDLFSNLCAINFPLRDDTALHNDITPVNIFPLIFNEYFDGHYALLPNDSYYFMFEEGATYKKITDEIRKQENEYRQSNLALKQQVAQ